MLHAIAQFTRNSLSLLITNTHANIINKDNNIIRPSKTDT